MWTDFVLSPLEEELYALQPERSPVVHHCGHGAQYVSIKCSERLAEAGIEPSVETGGSYDNVLTETSKGLRRAELIHRRSPWKAREAVQPATQEWAA